MKQEEIAKEIENLFRVLTRDTISFFEKNFIDQMVEAQTSLFPYDHPSPIGKALKKVISDLKTDLEAMDDQAKKEYFEGLQNRYFNETKLFFSEHLYELLYICLLKSLFSPDFIPVSNTLSRQYRESIREEFGLKPSGEFQKQFLEIFKRFIPEPVTVGDSEGFWNKWTRLYFLSSYNRHFGMT